MNQRQNTNLQPGDSSLSYFRQLYRSQVEADALMDQKTYCKIRRKAFYFVKKTLFSNGATSAILFSLMQALLFLTTKSFWPAAVLVICRAVPLKDGSDHLLLDSGDGIVPIGFVLIALGVIFVAFMLRPYANKRYQAKDSSDFLEKPWSISKIWRLMNYFLLVLASIASFITLSYVADGQYLSFPNLPLSFSLLSVLITSVFHCLLLTPKNLRSTHRKILFCAIPTIAALLMPAYPLLSKGFLFEPLPLFVSEIIFLTTLLYATCWFSAIGSSFLSTPSTPRTKSNGSKKHEFTWWLMRDGILGCLLFTLCLMGLFLLTFTIALVASFPFMVAN